jgi:hypothetical protein
VSAIVHTSAAISELLRSGLTPITDNAEALAELGFERVYPQHEHDFESMIWERTVEVAARSRDGKRMLARERAFLYAGGR